MIGIHVLGRYRSCRLVNGVAYFTMDTCAICVNCGKTFIKKGKSYSRRSLCYNLPKSNVSVADVLTSKWPIVMSPESVKTKFASVGGAYVRPQQK